MKKKKVSGQSAKDRSEKIDQPDYQLKPIKEKDSGDKPQIFKIMKRNTEGKSGRRFFLHNVSGAVGLASLGQFLEGCEAKYTLTGDDQACTCHAECTCVTVTVDKKHSRSSTEQYEYYGTKCSCNSVCTCDLVCTCDAECSCESDCTCDSECSCHSHCACEVVCSCESDCTCETVSYCPLHRTCTCDLVHHHYWYPC